MLGTLSKNCCKSPKELKNSAIFYVNSVPIPISSYHSYRASKRQKYATNFGPLGATSVCSPQTLHTLFCSASLIGAWKVRTDWRGSAHQSRRHRAHPDPDVGIAPPAEVRSEESKTL